MVRLVLGLLTMTALAPGVLAQEGVSAPAFELEDQYGKRHRVEFPGEKVSVIAFADRAGSSQLEGWIRPLYERYRDAIAIHGVAKVAGVPRLARALLRRIFRRHLEYPVMMDWTGTVSTNYEYEKRVANVIVLSPAGQREYRFNGPASPEELERCFARIDQLLKAASVEKEPAAPPQ